MNVAGCTAGNGKNEHSVKGTALERTSAIVPAASASYTERVGRRGRGIFPCVCP